MPMADTIAVIFDFDDTLASDSTSGFLHQLGIDVKAFWGERVMPLIGSGWDPVPAYLYAMLEVSNGDPARRITRERLMRWGRHIRLHGGATRVFERLTQHARSVSPDIEVEFYLVSSGIGETLRATRIARHFHDIWACDFAYGSEGEIVFPKNIVSFTDKTRYIFHVQKGIVGSSWATATPTSRASHSSARTMGSPSGSMTPPTASAGAAPGASSKTAGSPTWCLPTTAATRR
jgi:hypothetical protein